MLGHSKIAGNGKFTLPAAPEDPSQAGNWAFITNYKSCEMEIINKQGPGQSIDYCYDSGSRA